jgi:CxxC motif-containing protein
MMADKMNIICTSCPVGCRLTVFEDKDGNIEVEGNVCKRGKNYAIDEFSDPKRIVTSSVRVFGGQYDMVSVKTDKPIKKELVLETLTVLKKAKVTAPIDVGGVIASNILGTDVSIVATRKVKAK